MPHCPVSSFLPFYNTGARTSHHVSFSTTTKSQQIESGTNTRTCTARTLTETQNISQPGCLSQRKSVKGRQAPPGFLTQSLTHNVQLLPRPPAADAYRTLRNAAHTNHPPLPRMSPRHRSNIFPGKSTAARSKPEHRNLPALPAHHVLRPLSRK